MGVDAVFSSMNISATGMSAQTRKMDVISNNIANVRTTRTEEGGPYKRQDLVFAPKIDSETGETAGVIIDSVKRDPSSGKKVYDPGHPDADKEGYVSYPNISMVRETVDMMQAVRAYEANIAAFEAAKDMVKSSLVIVQ